MTKEQFNEAARWTMQQIDQEEIDYNWYLIGKNHLYELTDTIESQISRLMGEWCDDHDMDTEAWLEFGDTMDVFCI